MRRARKIENAGQLEHRPRIEAERAKQRLGQTAAEAYAERWADIAVIMDCLSMELDKHAKLAAEYPENWGFAGELGRIRETVKSVLESMLISLYGWSETEASRFIDDRLEAMHGE
jgi:hypothetical protein